VLAAASSDNIVDSRVGAAGAGELHVARSGGASVVTRARAASPLKLLTPANHGDAAWIFTSTYGGGLVEGDAIALDVHVGDEASAFISTQASTKIYRSTRVGARSTLTARVDAGALVVLLPDPVVCFADSRYAQTQTFDLHRDAALVCLDWITSGRRARGERWAFDDYRARLDVRVDGRRICHDAVTLAADDGDLGERFGRFDVFATLAIVGDRFAGDCRRLVEAIAHAPVERRADRLIAAAPIGGTGALVRVAGRSVEDVGRVIRETLAFLPPVLGDDPWTRKW
jgi:urease accessory protein